MVAERPHRRQARLTEADARLSLSAHAAARGEAVRLIHGPHVTWKQLQAILSDRTVTRYPCEVVFDDGPLLSGECAHAVARSERPEDGFILYIHPFFATRLADVPALALYQLVLVNYGEFASPEDAESFGAAILGLDREAYYHWLCDLADELAETEAAA